MTMIERRRFFPSSPVQTVPGQKAEVEVQLHKGGEAPAVPTCAPTGFEWGVQSAVLKEEQLLDGGPPWTWAEWPDFTEVKEGFDETTGRWGSMTPGTAYLRLRYDRNYNELSSHWKREALRLDYVTVTPIGPACGLTWEVAWENGVAPDGYKEYHTDGPVLKFHARKTDGGGETRTLTAIFTAKCASKEVGKMRLVILEEAY